MTKVLARTAPILDEADRFQRIMDWQLFTMEQENMLWGYNESVSWEPGKPLYQDPRSVSRMSSLGCSCCAADDEELEGYYGHHVRPMYQLINDGDRHWNMRCKDCDVTWRNGTECWMCGTDYPEYGVKIPAFSLGVDHASIFRSFEPIGEVTEFRSDELGLYVQGQLRAEIGNQWREVMNNQMQNYFSIGIEMQNNFSAAAERAAESLRGFSSHFVISDEWVFGMNPGARITPYRSPNQPVPPTECRVRGYIANPNRDVFTQPDVVGPLWGTAALYDPLDLPTGWFTRPDLPENWGDVAFEARAIPLPQMPELPPVQQGARWDREDSRPITERRRNRT